MINFESFFETIVIEFRNSPVAAQRKQKHANIF